MWFVKARRAANPDDDETWKQGGVTTTLNAFDNGGESRATVLILDGTRIDDVRVYEGVVQTMTQRWGTGGGQVPSIYEQNKVRRLTPMECERLQGFPDNWTASQSDSQRYRQMGNAVTVNVIESIGQQLGRVI